MHYAKAKKLLKIWRGELMIRRMLLPKTVQLNQKSNVPMISSVSTGRIV
jgi:hypothetical protein